MPYHIDFNHMQICKRIDCLLGHATGMNSRNGAKSAKVKCSFFCMN